MNQQSTQPYDDENDAQEPVIAGNPNEIPEGIYDVRGIEGSNQEGTADTGTEQVSIEVEFVDLKRRATTILYFSEKSEVDSLKKLRAMGWEGGDTLAGISKNVVRASVKYEEYQGERRMKVDIFAGGKFVMKKPMNDQEKRGFFARMNSIAAREGILPGSAGVPAAAPKAKGYPADWDKGGKAPAAAPAGNRPPRVDL